MSSLYACLTMALATFFYDNTTIRTAGTIANPLFCLSDVCAILDVANIYNKAAKLCDGNKFMPVW